MGHYQRLSVTFIGVLLLVLSWAGVSMAQDCAFEGSIYEGFIGVDPLPVGVVNIDVYMGGSNCTSGTAEQDGTFDIPCGTCSGEVKVILSKTGYIDTYFHGNFDIALNMGVWKIATMEFNDFLASIDPDYEIDDENAMVFSHVAWVDSYVTKMEKIGCVTVDVDTQDDSTVVYWAENAGPEVSPNKVPNKVPQ